MARIVNNHMVNCSLISSVASFVSTYNRHSAVLASHTHLLWSSDKWSRFPFKSSPLLTAGFYSERGESIQHLCIFKCKAWPGDSQSLPLPQAACFTMHILSFSLLLPPQPPPIYAQEKKTWSTFSTNVLLSEASRCQDWHHFLQSPPLVSLSLHHGILK